MAIPGWAAWKTAEMAKAGAEGAREYMGRGATGAAGQIAGKLKNSERLSNAKFGTGKVAKKGGKKVATAAGSMWNKMFGNK